MLKSKGMSQILVLIVAAAVLMMVGLLLISLSSDSITGTFDDTESVACNAQVEQVCNQNDISSGTSLSSEEIPVTCGGSSYSCP